MTGAAHQHLFVECLLGDGLRCFRNHHQFGGWNDDFADWHEDAVMFGAIPDANIPAARILRNDRRDEIAGNSKGLERRPHFHFHDVNPTAEQMVVGYMSATRGLESIEIVAVPQTGTPSQIDTESKSACGTGVSLSIGSLTELQSGHVVHREFLASAKLLGGRASVAAQSFEKAHHISPNDPMEQNR